MEKQKVNSSFSSKVFRNGAYSAAVTVIVIAVLIVVNLLVTSLHVSWDISGRGLFTLSSETKEFLSTLEDDIDIYYLGQEGAEDETIKRMVDLFDKANSHITVTLKDPTLYPDFIKQYVDTTTTRVSANSLIVVNEKLNRSKYVSTNNMLKYTSSSTNSYGYELSGYDVEGQVASAIQYVTKTELPKIYTITGHGESAFSSTIQDYVSKQNIDSEELNLINASEIPEDAKVLILNAPVTDLNDMELELLINYLRNGGKMMIFATYTSERMPNFDALLEEYGMRVVDGMLIETNSSMTVNGISYFISPSTLDATMLEDYDASKPVALAYAVGLANDVDVRSSVTTFPLLMTSSGAFSKMDMSSATFDKSEGDLDGPFYVGMAATETYNNKITGLVVFGSPALVSGISMYGGALDFSAYSTLGNVDMFSTMLKWMIGDTTTSSLYIPAKTFTQEYLMMSSQVQNVLALATIVVIPLIFIVIGVIVFIRRRRL